MQSSYSLRCKLFGHDFETEDAEEEGYSFRARCRREACDFETMEKEPVEMVE